jgi:integrase
VFRTYRVLETRGILPFRDQANLTLLNENVAIAKWRKASFTLRAHDDKLTLTYLSLQGTETSKGPKVQKASAAKINVYQCDGAGVAVYVPNAKTILLRRSDFLRLHDYTLHHGPLRDFCLFRVPMKCGVRPGEIATLRWENVDFSRLTLNVLDSKKHILSPVPMDLATADYLRELKGDFTEGLVIRHDPNCRVWRHLEGRLSKENLQAIVKKRAKLAGCETWQKMRMYDLRHYFAANWAYPADGKRPGNLHTLATILRDNPFTIHVYLSRLVFYEDIQAEYNRLQTSPFVQSQNGQQTPTVGNEFFDRYCRVCMRRPTCRYIDQAMMSNWASGCRYFEKTMLKECEKE